MILTEQQHAFCSAYLRNGSATGAAVYAGYHPASGYRLLENFTTPSSRLSKVANWLPMMRWSGPAISSE